MDRVGVDTHGNDCWFESVLIERYLADRHRIYAQETSEHEPNGHLSGTSGHEPNHHLGGTSEDELNHHPG